MNILITGASRGIGRALCLEGVRRGYKVHATVRKVQDEVPGSQVHILDVRDRKSVYKVIQEVAPQIDCFIINAGLGNSLNPRKADSAEKAAEIIEVNTTAAISSAYAMAYE